MITDALRGACDRVARIERGDPHRLVLRHVAWLLGCAGVVAVADARFDQIAACLRLVAAESLAGNRTVAAVLVVVPSRKVLGQRCPGLGAVEGAADVQLVAVVAHCVEAPVGRPGVEHHHEVAVQEAAVPLGHVQRVVPGLICERAGIGRSSDKQVSTSVPSLTLTVVNSAGQACHVSTFVLLGSTRLPRRTGSVSPMP